MIINNIKRTISGKYTTVSCDVKSNSDKRVYTVWYKFDRHTETNVMDDASFTLSAFLIPCMHLGEDLEIKGVVSPKLLKNAYKIMDLFVSWNQGFKRINIKTNSNYKSVSTKNKSASFFSLGVDSFYTYLKHKGTKSVITNLIFVHGFDIDVKNSTFYKSTLSRLTKIGKTEKINIISVQTNVKNITDRYIEWDWEHGGAMASVADILNKSFNQVFFAGSDSWTQRKKTMPYGTHPKLDGLWSSNNLKVVHDGNEATRFQKIKRIISKSDLALQNLRVCNQNLKGKYNCSNCEKCLRTMIDLQITGALVKSKTLDHEIPLIRLSKIHNEDFDTKYYFEDSLKELKRINKYRDLQLAIEKSLYKSDHPSVVTKTIKYLSHLDKKYNDHKIFNYIFGLSSDGDRKPIFKLLAKLTIIR